MTVPTTLDAAMLELVRTLADNVHIQDTAILNLVQTLTKTVITLSEIVEKQSDRITVLEHEQLTRGN
jgi:hypothetical protein